ncbi:MAG: transcription termination factor NusA [Ruminococcus sp.]|nr:transcription termination factor NusA [Ruminococcus sp.]MCM1380960.1 transcription termination factor NusA [Muribaculaceae bacterium]MCM1478623.1 transcription termination factor NusA [Muribaculaceae bacterium]
MNNKEFFAALELLAKENGIPMDLLVEKIKQGIARAIKKEYPYCEDFLIEIVPEEEKFEITLMRTVVEELPLDMSEITVEEAAAYLGHPVAVDEVIPYKLATSQFGRVAAQNAKQAIRTEIKTFERQQYIEKFEGKLHEAVSATVQRIEPESGNATLTIDKNEVYLYKNEQIPGEVLKEGDIVKLYVADIINPDRKPMVKVSRTHKDLVKRLFELEIPEIYDGTVEVKSISREAGARTKIAVWSKDKNVDPVGACIGPRHSRIGGIVNELRGEKIDIIVWDEDPAVFIAHALSPANVLRVDIEADSEQKSCVVIVPNNQLSLAIGNKGQNAKLAARLTGYKIDIKPEKPIA